AASRRCRATLRGFGGSVSTTARSPGVAASRAESATRSSPSATHSTPGRPPRHRCRRRRIHGPAGRLVWENVLTGKIGGRPLENLDFHLQSALVPAQLGELLLLLARQLGHATVVVDVGLGHPVPQTRLGNA